MPIDETAATRIHGRVVTLSNRLRRCTERPLTPDNVAIIRSIITDISAALSVLSALDALPDQVVRLSDFVPRVSETQKHGGSEG